MKKMRVVLLLVIVVGIVGGGFMLWRWRSMRKTESYYLDIVNTGNTRAEIQVSLCDDPLFVEAETAKMFKIEKQDPTKGDVPREFVIRAGGKSQNAKGTVAYNDHTIVDVTGDSCIVVADYALQYRADTLKLPEGTRTIKILKVWQKPHPQVFAASPFDRQSGRNEFQVDLGIGEPLPESRKGRGQYVKTVRMLVVPCDVAGDEKALYDFVAKN